MSKKINLTDLERKVIYEALDSLFMDEFDRDEAKAIRSAMLKMRVH